MKALGALEHVAVTEDGPRKPEDVSPARIEKIVGSLHKRHEKLLKLIEGEISQEKAG